MATCVRTAWLVLGTSTLLLEDATKGYFCTDLDLGFPTVREVVSDRPDQDGVDDRTMYMGARVVSASISAIQGAGAQVDAVASSFAPFMLPSARPVLHYVLDRPGAAERTLTLRAAGYAWPIAGPYQRDINLQWVAADPVARDPTQKTATAFAGTSPALGRIYPLTFNRTYPLGGVPGTTPNIVSNGEVPVRPLVRVYGPITGARVNFGSYGVMAFQSNYIIDAGHFVDLDTANKTARRDSDPAQNVLAQLNWSTSTWPVLPVMPAFATMTVTGSNTTSSSQVQAIWQDGFLS
jgi:hypothetical protein